MSKQVNISSDDEGEQSKVSPPPWLLDVYGPVAYRHFVRLSNQVELSEAAIFQLAIDAAYVEEMEECNDPAPTEYCGHGLTVEEPQ